MNIERLEKLGLNTASKKVKEMREMKHKMTIAYEHYRFVKEEKIVAFNTKLSEESRRENKDSYSYSILAFTSLETYTEVPPEMVLDKIEEAIKRGCFDSFEIARIRSVEVKKDPIVFGRINGCPDRFFVAQWDDDVKIEDILKENEG